MSLTPVDEQNPLVEMSGINLTNFTEYEDVEPKLPDKYDNNYPIQRMFEDMDFKSLDNIHKFSREGEVERLAAIIKHNPTKARQFINILNTEKMAPLHIAARYNHLDCVKVLVELGGADVNVVNEERLTPIHFAARYRRKSHKHNETDFQINIEIMSKKQSEESRKRMMDEECKPTVDNSVILYLVAMYANPNAQDCYGCTPLHYAAMRGNEVAANQLLILDEVNTEVEDNESMTPLHLACAHNHQKIAEMLLSCNANLFNREESGLIPFHIVCTEGNFYLAQKLISLAEDKKVLKKMLNAVDNELNTPLHYAVENGHIDIVKLCLEKGADPNDLSYDGETPLHMASHCGSVDLVKILVAAGSDLNVLDNSDQTALHKAAMKNHVGVIEYLIKNGADTESRDRDSYTPLLIAASYGHCEALNLLVNYNCDVFATEKANKSILYLAVEQNYPALVNTILKSEPNRELLSIPDMKSNYPLHIASKHGRVEIVKILLDYHAEEDVKNEEEQTPMHLAAKYGKLEIIKILLDISKDSLISDEDEDSNTPLHLAAENGHTRVVQFLLDKGADIIARNCNKWTALDCAAAQGKVKVAQVLLANDSLVDPMDKSKITPLYLACKHGHEKMVRLLIANNADIGMRVVGDDIDAGSNPLDAAIDNGHKECALEIINTNNWERAMRNQSRSGTEKIDTPIRKLIRKMPDLAEIVFNRCCNVKSASLKKDVSVTYNFEFLEDTYANWGMNRNAVEALSTVMSEENVAKRDSETASLLQFGVMTDCYDENGNLLAEARAYSFNSRCVMENHPLMIMVKSEREELLAHPLVTNLLKIKWNSFGQVVYYTNLSVYLLFLITFLIYMCEAVAPYKYFLRNNAILLNSTTCLGVQHNFPGETLEISAIVTKYFVLVLSAFGVFKEILQIFMQRKHYFVIENLMEWLLYILAFITVMDTSSCQHQIGIREPWQWNTGAVGSLIGIFNLVLFIRKVPFFGIFVVMFTDVMWTFIKFLPLFILFIFAFAFAFFVLLNNQLAFNNLFNSMLRTGVMVIGEFDFNDVFNAQFEQNAADNQLIFYDEVTYMIFVVFILMMSIITMNLLVGLAVDDIKMVQEKATLKRLAMKVTLALDVEALVPEFLRKRHITRTFKDLPNRRGFFSKFFDLSQDQYFKEPSNDTDPYKRLELAQKSTNNQIDNLKNRMKDIQIQNDKMLHMVNQVLNYWKIKTENDDLNIDEEI